MSTDIPMTVLHLGGGHVLAAVTTSGSVTADADALTGGSHLPVTVQFVPPAVVEVPLAELTAVQLTGPSTALDLPLRYRVEDVGGPRLGGVAGAAPAVSLSNDTVAITDPSTNKENANLDYLVVLMTGDGPTVARATLDAQGASSVTSPTGAAVTAALVAVEGRPVTLEPS